MIDTPRWRSGEAPSSPLAILVDTLPIGLNCPPALMRINSSSMETWLLLAVVAGVVFVVLFFQLHGRVTTRRYRTMRGSGHHRNEGGYWVLRKINDYFIRCQNSMPICKGPEYTSVCEVGIVATYRIWYLQRDRQGIICFRDKSIQR